jgi:hypothetical protein
MSGISINLCIFVTVDMSELGCHNFLQLNKFAAVSFVGAKVGVGGRKWGRK